MMIPRPLYKSDVVRTSNPRAALTTNVAAQLDFAVVILDTALFQTIARKLMASVTAQNGQSVTTQHPITAT